MTRWLPLAFLAAGLVVAVGRAHGEPAGDAVALLPLDADRSLELYGQPVARAIARALENGNVQVVVVGPKMAVPEHARLIIDGTIAPGKATAVTISLRIRSTLDGKVLDTLSATAPGLARIDVTAAELSARTLPIVQARLAALASRPADHGRVTQVRTPSGSGDAAAVPGPVPPTPSTKVIALSVVDSTRGGGTLLAALDTAAGTWTRAHHREPRKLEASRLDRKVAASAVTAAGAELAIGFWILGYTTEGSAPPMARARVRVQIADATGVVFDRVVVTDTVLGDNRSSAPELAARVAREILAIVRLHVRRLVPSWS